MALKLLSSGSGEFTLDAPASASNRTITLPDATTTLVGTDATQTLTNKTITGPSLQVNSASGNGIGYATGAGGSVTQLTSKSTSVELNTLSGKITMHNAALAASTTAGFTLTNSKIVRGDTVQMMVNGGVTNAGNYIVWAGGAGVADGVIGVFLLNRSTGSLSEAVELYFTITKGATA